MGSQSVLIEEFFRSDQETGQEVKVQRFAPGKPRRGLITRLTANVADACDGCIYADGACIKAIEEGHDFPCNTEGAEKDRSGGEMFPRGEE